MPGRAASPAATWHHRLDELLRRRGHGAVKELADKLGVDDTQVSHYRKGRRVPDLNEVTTICMAFKVSADWLLGTPEAKGVPLPLVEEAAAHLALAQRALGVRAIEAVSTRARAGVVRTAGKASTRAKRGAG